MKKLALALATVATLAVSSVCAAAGDGTILNKEQKFAEGMTAALTTEEGTYTQAAAGFNADLKGKLAAAQFDQMKKAVKNQFGSLKESRFVSFTRFKDGDRVQYVGTFTKEPQVSLTYLFDATGKIFNFAFSPIKPAQAPAKAPAAPAKK